MSNTRSGPAVELSDQRERDRFREQLDRNFSVVAPAGVGKTTAIIRRIVRLAETDVLRENKALPRLVLVTYTKKAAAEMRDRARLGLMTGGADMVERLAGFNSAFFGTIHSFCLQLLRQHGYLIGLPTKLELVQDDESLWREFIRTQDSLLDGLSEAGRRYFSRYASLLDLSDLARKLPPNTKAPVERALPDLDLSTLLNFKPSKRNEQNVSIGQTLAREWLKQHKNATEPWLAIPDYTKGGSEFKSHWHPSFDPLRDWLAETALIAAAGLARRGLEYRLSKGMLRYDDMVDLAQQLMLDPVAGERIRREEYIVILDEAQDTDPAQFDVLLEVTRPVGARSSWRDGAFPAPGRFCMVGDPQQSIYSDRADIRTYLDVHQRLVSSPGGEGASFTVTMRCEREIVSWVNETMEHSLNGRDGQVDFVKLITSPSAGCGSVQRLPLLCEDAAKRKTMLSYEAEELARWLSATGPKGFGVSDWSEVALLCPRRNHLEVLEDALAKKGLRTQNHSRRDLLQDTPAYAWGIALVTIMAEPEDAFEVAGVLRNVFAISDDLIADYVSRRWVNGAPHPLTLTTIPRGDGEVEEALGQLRSVRSELQGKSLREAFSIIVERLQLLTRVASIPKADTIGLTELAHLASKAEEAGEDLVSWAAQLRQQGNSGADEADPERGCIQLFTCHKAKGLEWPVVILPFFFSEITDPPTDYPKLLRLLDGSTCLAWDSNHQRTQEKNEVSLREVQTRARLLYVAMTRPRRKLILIDDEALFPGGNKSFGAYLGVTEADVNRDAWEQLPVFVPESDTLETVGSGKDDAKPKREELEVFPETIPYLKRVLPSSLAKHKGSGNQDRDERDRHLEPAYPEISIPGGGDGIEYGNWWHMMMQTLPWEQAQDKWSEHFEKQLELCPQPERGRLEIDLFLQTELAARLSGAVWVKTEVPLLWRAVDDVVYDGSIDLLARLGDEEWLIIDWKTDQVENDPAEELLQTYGPQLGAYQQSIAAQVRGTCAAALYSTRKGVTAWDNLHSQA